MPTLRQEIDAIITDASLSYEEKGTRLSKLITQQELAALLPKPSEAITLKQPIAKSAGSAKTLHLSIYDVYFEQIIKGLKKEEYREYKDYYIKKCTYEENGKRYLVPFKAITFYVGRGKNAKRTTVAVRDITCDGFYIVFHLGAVISR